MGTGQFSWTPLFSTIIDSSVWLTSKETRLLWITMLAKKDRNGFVRGVVRTLARDAGLTVDECRAALAVLEAPDVDSHCRENEGRRIKAVDGGWVVLNHLMYRNLISRAKQRADQAAWQREYRKRLKVERVGAECGGAREAIREGFEAAGLPVEVAAWVPADAAVEVKKP